MPRKVTIKYVSLKSSLVNLPISMYGPLVESRIKPQSLAVHLTLLQRTSPASAYLGWTGMASASSITQWQGGPRGSDTLETVEIDPQLASSLGFVEGSTVEIGLLYDLPVAKSVSTEPNSFDDWEILELHAGYVEDNLLSQVRAASVGQEIDVWVLGRTRVRFTVVSFDPAGPAVLLGSNTEVSIAPKVRSKSRLVKALSDPSSKREDAAVKRQSDLATYPRVILRALPNYLWTFTPQTKPINDPDALALVSPASFQKLTGESLLLSHSSSGSCRRLAFIRRLHPPSSPPVKGRSSDSPLVTSQLHPRIISNLGSNSTGLKDPSLLKSVPIAEIGWSNDIPDHHVALSYKDDTQDYDLVQLRILSHEEQEAHLGGLKTSTLSPSFIPGKLSPSSQSSSNLLAGVDHILQQCHEFVTNSLAIQAEEQSKLALKVPALLLCGRSGSGRTSIAKVVMKQLAIDKRTLMYSNYIDLTKYGEESVSTLKALFQYWLDLAKWHRPGLLVLDNLERVAPAEVEHTDSFRSRHLAEHFISVFGAKCAISAVTLIATCQNRSAIHPLLLSSHLFTTIISFKPPDKDARRDILASLTTEKLCQSELQVDPEQALNYVSLATQTEGYLPTDLHDLVSRAVHQATIRGAKENSDVILRQEDFISAQADFVPLSLRDVKLQKSEISWTDIGGLHETRRVLRETLEWPTKYAPIFMSCPLRLRSGLLLYGYPGCGKTLIASAVAKECGLNFISVKGPELLNKYIGASEKSVRDLFERASAAKPCILFFDEFDSIAPKRGHDSTGVTDRVVNQLLTQMDGAEGLDGVYVLAATSRPDLIDPALLRPGRLDKSLLCNMPSKAERKEIMEAIARKMRLAEDVDLDYYADATEGYSGADLQALIYNAYLEVVHSVLENPLEGQIESEEPVDVTYTSFGGAPDQQIMSRAEQDAMKRRLAAILAAQNPTKQKKEKSNISALSKYEIRDAHLQRCLHSMRPSVPPEEHRKLERVYQAFVASRSGELPVPPEIGGVGNRVSLI